jgi:S1-C subfamily serine protease
MMKAALAVLCLFLSSPAFAQKPSQAQVSRIYNSVAELFVEDDSGSMHMACSATAFEKVQNPGSPVTYKYRFASAAHCVTGDSDAKQKLEKFFISDDVKGEKTFTAAKLIEAGDKTKGDDFSLFEVKTALDYEYLPLGDNQKLQLGDPVLSVAAPYGLGKQFYMGYISELSLDRPPVDAGSVQWTDLMLIEIGGGPGSSGSSIVSVDQNAIIGFLVGGASGDVGKLCVPVSKFKAFVEAVDKGTYKKSTKGQELSDKDEE